MSKQFIYALLTLALCIYLSSGTVAPYGSSCPHPIIDESGCVFNSDHPHFYASYKLLNGAPKAEWEGAVALRRILYPLLCFPFMKMFGFNWGGLVGTLILHILALFLLYRYFLKSYSEKVAISASCLFATYPGITYWSGVPYHHASIVPVTIFSFLCLENIASLIPISSLQSNFKVAINALVIGVLFYFYDLAIFFIPAVYLMLIFKKSWSKFLSFTLGFAISQVIMVTFLTKGLDINLIDSNSVTYKNIINGYLNIINFTSNDYSEWMHLLSLMPRVLFSNFIFSNFLFLPLLFLFFLFIGYKNKVVPSLVETCLFLSILAVFLFNNCAPKYEGWQLRGTWIARIYQPIFIVYFSYIFRVLASTNSIKSTNFRPLILIFALLNLSVTLSLYLKLPHGTFLYDRFYKHSKKNVMIENLDRYGTYPLGFCNLNPELNLR